jgi:hypothetical protein
MYGQGVIASRPISTSGSPGIQGRVYYATDQLIWYYDYGTGWVAFLSKDRINPDVAGTLPTSGVVDGDIINYYPAASQIWRFRFDAGLSPYKWVYIGGNSLYLSDLTDESTSSTSYTNLTTVDSITVPFTGIYEVDFGAEAYCSAGAPAYPTMSVKYGASEAVDNDSSRLYGGTVMANSQGIIGRKIQVTVTSASTAILLRYKTTTGTSRFLRRWMSITPVRVI